MTQNWPKKPWKWSKHPQKCFWWFKYMFWNFFRRILGPELPKNAPNVSKKMISWSRENSDFWPKNDPKSTQKRPKSGQNTPQNVSDGSNTFFGTFSDEYWAQKCPKILQIYPKKSLLKSGNLGFLTQKWPKIDPKTPRKWSKHPLRCFWRSKKRVLERIYTNFEPRNAQKCPKTTQNRYTGTPCGL